MSGLRKHWCGKVGWALLYKADTLDPALLYQEHCAENHLVSKPEQAVQSPRERGPEMVGTALRLGERSHPAHLISTVSDCPLPGVFRDEVCKYPADLHNKGNYLKSLPETDDECFLASAQRA